ncbi:MAG: hypothetical protein LBR43_01245 [Spiroplasmataceae bacterium]|nr:hypothetical protein [Spiroplasmataceae bacterium]
MKAKQISFWEQLKNQKITGRGEIEQYLTDKLGIPNNQLASNCLVELIKKVNSYYQEEQSKNYSIFSLEGIITSPEQVVQKKFKKGKRMGQTYYVLKIGTEKLQVLQELLPKPKWNQIAKLAILNQKLVFKYRKWITNKDLLDFYPNQNSKKAEDCKPPINLGESPEREEKLAG